jgi:hypothetical protein
MILREAHDSAFSIHPGSTKMYKDLKTGYWWYGIKIDITEYLSLCDTCHRVKVEPEDHRIVATIENPRVEMGGNCNGFYSRVTPYPS